MSDEVAVKYVPRFEAFSISHPSQTDVRTILMRTFVRDNSPSFGGAPMMICECPSGMAALDIADALNLKYNSGVPA